MLGYASGVDDNLCYEGRGWQATAEYLLIIKLLNLKKLLEYPLIWRKKMIRHHHQHSSVITGLYLMKSSSKMLQNLPYFIYLKTQSCFFCFSFHARWKKQLWVFVYIKYGKFWSILLGHFIKHKPLISEVWPRIFSGWAFFQRITFHNVIFSLWGFLSVIWYDDMISLAVFPLALEYRFFFKENLEIV